MTLVDIFQSMFFEWLWFEDAFHEYKIHGISEIKSCFDLTAIECSIQSLREIDYLITNIVGNIFDNKENCSACIGLKFPSFDHCFAQSSQCTIRWQLKSILAKLLISVLMTQNIVKRIHEALTFFTLSAWFNSDSTNLWSKMNENYYETMTITSLLIHSRK